jgi:hypothetical protein
VASPGNHSMSPFSRFHFRHRVSGHFKTGQCGSLENQPLLRVTSSP